MASVANLIEAFRACKGDVIAKDANTGAEAKVIKIEEVASARYAVSFTVTVEGAKQYTYEANLDYDPNTITGDSWLLIRILQPPGQGTEATEMQILSGGLSDYPVESHGSGNYKPTLALTLINTGAVERNKPLVEAFQNELRQKQEEKDREKREQDQQKLAEFRAAQHAHSQTYRENAVLPLLEALKGQTLEDIALEEGLLVLTFANVPPLRIKANDKGTCRYCAAHVVVECADRRLLGCDSTYKGT